MTESEWLAGSDVEEMLKHLGHSASARKLRYFLVACARRVLPPDPVRGCWALDLVLGKG